MSAANPHERPNKPTRSQRMFDALMVYNARLVTRMTVGKDNDDIMREFGLGICEDGIIGSSVAFPDPEYDSQHLTYRTAGIGQWKSHDFRRAEFFPAAARRMSHFTLYTEGILTAFMLDSVADAPIDVRTNLTFQQAWGLDRRLTHEHPTMGRLLELGIVEERTQEDAFEQARATKYIDELRAKGLAADTVYQVTPKGNGLVELRQERGDPTRRRGKKIPAANGARLAHIQQS